MLVTVLNYNAFWEMRQTHNIDDSTVETYKSDTIFISILDSAKWFAKPQFQKDHSNVITLQFDDVLHSGDRSPTNDVPNTRSFAESDGKKIIEFLENNPDAKFCVVHCAAGISRSGAIGQFVNDYYKGDYDSFVRHNPQIMPNQMVIQTLNRLVR